MDSCRWRQVGALGVTVVSEPELSVSEQDQLARCERAIERGVRGFVAAGRALGEIRDGRLYRTEFDTFEEYCRERWGWSRSYSYRLLDAAAVADAVSPVGDISNERQARELVSLLDQPDEMRDVWSEAVERSDGKPTADDVRAVRRERERDPLAIGDPESDFRFEIIEDMVALMEMLPAPDKCVFPTAPGDVEVIGDGIKQLVGWSSQMMLAWRQHRRHLRYRELKGA